MEEDQCCMWTKRKYSLTSSNILTSTLKPSYDESWEEQAFSEEQALVWPPRSYSCSFCSREFRSAQALGGHMNVHRRDRARLKQPPSEDDDDHHIPQNPLTSPNTNPNSDDLDLLAFNPKFPPCYDSKSWSQKFDTKKEVEAADIVSCKRRRITDASSIPFFSKSISEIDNRHHHHHHHNQHDHIKLKMEEFISPSSIDEELDLELRLGHSISKGRPGDCYFDLQQKT